MRRKAVAVALGEAQIHLLTRGRRVQPPPSPSE
jgi:hypothetical protein